MQADKLRTESFVMIVRTSPDVGTKFVVDFASGSLIPSVFIGVYPWFNCFVTRARVLPRAVPRFFCHPSTILNQLDSTSGWPYKTITSHALAAAGSHGQACYWPQPQLLLDEAQRPPPKLPPPHHYHRNPAKRRTAAPHSLI